MPVWMESRGPENDVVISSRVRLARNFDDIPFPTMMNAQEAGEVIEKTRTALQGDRGQSKGRFEYHLLRQTNAIDRNIWVEEHLASPDLLKNTQSGAIFIKEDETISIMVNEEDHLRIQSLLPGLQLEQAMERANEIDDLIEEHNRYSFDEWLGYLTCCPTNVGTGMRASIMMHLPALSMTGYVSPILQTVSKIGLTVRGIYGEGTEALGNMYQISNQITLGQTEEDMIRNLLVSSHQIIEKERMARSTIIKTSRIELEDRLGRSYGVFAHARKMDSQEFMKLFSDVRLAADLKMIKHVDDVTLNQLMIQAQPANLQRQAGRELSPEERDIIRAELVRKVLAKQ